MIQCLKVEQNVLKSWKNLTSIMTLCILLTITLGYKRRFDMVLKAKEMKIIWSFLEMPVLGSFNMDKEKISANSSSKI